jgi:hypothetical protein
LVDVSQLIDMQAVNTMSPILKLDEDDENKEIDFELDYQLSLNVEQRFRMMFQKSKEIAEMLVKNGHRRPFEIIKR